MQPRSDLQVIQSLLLSSQPHFHAQKSFALSFEPSGQRSSSRSFFTPMIALRTDEATRNWPRKRKSTTLYLLNSSCVMDSACASSFSIKDNATHCQKEAGQELNIACDNRSLRWRVILQFM